MKALAPFLVAVFFSCVSINHGVLDLGPGRCLISRIDVFECIFLNPKSTKSPGPNEYGIYTTRFKGGNSGTPYCGIRKKNHKIRKTETIGDTNQVFILYSPGITLEPPTRYGNQMLVNYSVQCPEGNYAFLNVTTIDMEEPNCFHAARNSTRCVDYVQVRRGSFGVTESCGTNSQANRDDFEFGTFRVLFRTSPRVRRAGFIASVICFDPTSPELEGCTRPEGSEDPVPTSNSNRKKRELQEFEEEWKSKMNHLRRVRRQVEDGKFKIRFIERNVPYGINVTFSEKKLDFIAVENGSTLEFMRIDNVDTLFTFDANGQLDVFKEYAQSDSGIVLRLPGPGPMFVVGRIAYFQLFVIDPRGLEPTMEEMEVIANLTEAQIELAREDNSSRLSSDFLNPSFNIDELGLPPELRRRRRSLEGEAPMNEGPRVAGSRGKRQASVNRVDRLSDDAVLAAIRNENACNLVLRSSARALLQEVEKVDPVRVSMLRATLTTETVASTTMK